MKTMNEKYEYRTSVFILFAHEQTNLAQLLMKKQIKINVLIVFRSSI